MILHLAIKQVWRERNNAQFRILALALWLAIFAVTVLSSLTQGARVSLSGQASNLLGADLVIESAVPLASEYAIFANEQKMSATTVVEFLSMVMAKDRPKLANIMAMGPNFPLRGDLLVQTLEGIRKKGPPPAGQLWMDETLVLQLNSQINDSVEIGNAHFKISGIIQQRPVALSDSAALAPTVYVNQDDLPAMGVLQPGSRATYRLLLAGSASQIKNYQQHFDQKASEVMWITPVEGRPSLSRTMTYVQRYLSIILFIQVLFAGIAIALCAHQYSLRQHKAVALWRSFGASSSMIVRLQVLALFLLALFVLITSIAAGYLAAMLAFRYGKSFGFTTASLGWHGLFLGVLTGIIMLLGFSLPPLLRLKHVSPIQILQREEAFLPNISLLSYMLSFLLLGGLFILFFGDPDLALRVGGQMLGLGAMVFIFSAILWHGLAPLSRCKSPAWRFGISYLMRHKWQGITQWLVFSMVVMLLLLVQIIQRDLIVQWQSALPSSTPNNFLLNIQPEQVESMQQWFENEGINSVQFYPIVRARMSDVNGIPIKASEPQQTKEQRGLNRPINLTWMKQLPQDNKRVEGEVWENIPPGEAFVSVEKGFAQRQKLKLGDTIGFQIADQHVSGKIVQLRTVEWESFKPNFFVIFPPKVIEQYPHSYITSLYVPEDKKTILNKLIKTYPEISVIDIDVLLKEVRTMMDKISYALDILLGLVFVLGILIMYAGLLSSLKERLHESALLQILGADRRFVIKVLAIEFGLLGFISGILASIMALLVAHDIANHFFDLPYGFELRWLWIGILLSTIVILVCGLFGARKVFQVSPLWLLRQN